MNPYISYQVTRVGRAPVCKLGPKDRLIRPASMYMKVTKMAPFHLAKTIATALEYHNEQDEEAVKLLQMIVEKGYSKHYKLFPGLMLIIR
ncbi:MULTISPECIES: mannitol dehydrogenase family protein [Bacillaceae]|nr:MULTISPECIES: hypothetical protein [Bacillaceae]